MTTSLTLLTSSLALLTACGSGRTEPPQAHYCNMGFFTPATLARHNALVPRMVAAVTERRELDNGYAFTFDGRFREAGEFVDGIRGCCPTIEYALTFAPHDGPATLQITGGPGAKVFIREEFHAIVQGT